MHAKVEPSRPHEISERADGPRESTRPIRALNRGLDMLTELNRLERAATTPSPLRWTCRAPPLTGFWRLCV